MTTKTCPRHGDYEASETSFNGNVFCTICPECEKDEISRIESEKRIELGESEKRKSMIDDVAFRCMSIPARYSAKTFATFDRSTAERERTYDAAFRFAKGFLPPSNSGDGLVLLGNVGTGKTHLAASCMLYLYQKGVRSKYTTLYDAIQTIRSEWSGKRKEDSILDILKGVPVLVIDEVGVQLSTPNEQAILFDLLDSRYANCLSTIIISNLPREQLKKIVGDRVFDRMIETMTFVGFSGDSHRINGK